MCFIKHPGGLNVQVECGEPLQGEGAQRFSPTCHLLSASSHPLAKCGHVISTWILPASLMLPPLCSWSQNEEFHTWQRSFWGQGVGGWYSQQILAPMPKAEEIKLPLPASAGLGPRTLTAEVKTKALWTPSGSEDG